MPAQDRTGTKLTGGTVHETLAVVKQVPPSLKDPPNGVSHQEGPAARVSVDLLQVLPTLEDKAAGLSKDG